MQPTYYEHEFSNPEDYLHHRSPYLMVQRILSIDETEISTEKSITSEEFFLQGHFPGAPIVPGALMQEMCTQSAGALIAAKYNPMQEFNTHDPMFNPIALGVLVRVDQARYRGFARIGDTLAARVVLNEAVDNLFDFSGSVSIGDRQIARIKFRLANIDSNLLQGN